MNVAVILAGGIGKRFGGETPKQFVEIFGKPAIAFALEIYEKSKFIDSIEVVCLPDYIDFVWKLAKTYKISKLKWIVEGGVSCQESTLKGIFALEGICKPEDLLSFNMSTSLFVTDEILEDSFKVAQEKGNAFAVTPCIYNLAYSTNGQSSTHINYKETHGTLNLPWTSSFGKLDSLYRKAYEQNIEMGETSYMPTLFLAMGETLYFSKDTPKNQLHIKTQDEFEIIKACLAMQQ